MYFYSFRTIYIANGTPHTLQWVLTYYQSFNRTCAVVILDTRINTATLKCTITQYLLIKLSSPRKKKKQRREGERKKHIAKKKYMFPILKSIWKADTRYTGLFKDL